YKQYTKNINFSIFLDEYKKMCINLGKNVKIIYNDKEIFGKIINITEYGQLVFLNEKNEEIKIISGEVSIRNIDGTYI
ncbi:MAG: biotin--[acetyl-CoA-carboxylase] ligase, partial [Eubacteriales bacterium]|nr:biotin--[acetyl-CoA-carboxylase] ligase [Eubacteriales bacterium]